MKILILIFKFQLLLQLSNAYWWYLGLQVDKKQQNDLNEIDLNKNLFELNKSKFGTVGLRKYCNSPRVLNSPVQRNICKRNEKVIEIIAKGAKMAIDECQYQFKFKRWNCTIFNKLNVFGRLIQTRSRETAFIYAINSAAAMYEITKACTKGELKGCSCNSQKMKREELSQNFGKYEWGGCSDNVIYGHKLSKYFVDSKEYSASRQIRYSDNKAENDFINKEYHLMNLHNNEVGRRTILKNMKQICKCHGVSGSCSVKVCWKVMPDFRVIGNELFQRYNLASQIKDARAAKRIEKLKMIVTRRSISFPNKDISSNKNYKDDLIFIDKSPNFCRQDSKFSTLGTKGRMCKIVKKSNEKNKLGFLKFYQNNTQSEETNSDDSLQTCDYLCCGRGYYSKIIETEEDCDCQFQWCCSVKCKKCKKKVIQYYCN